MADDNPPKRLKDAHWVARVSRLWDMAQNGATDERAAAAAEYTDLIWGDADLREGLYDAVEHEAAARSLGAGAPHEPSLADTDWTFSKDRCRRLRGSRRCNGVVLAVRESASQRGTYYPVVDGHHLSAHGGSKRNMDFSNAVGAAEAAAEAHAAAIAEEEG